MNITSAFDSFAQEYDHWFDTHSVEYKLELDVVRQMLPGNGQGIEIGTGTGRFSEPLDISTGIEPSRAMSRIASSRGIQVIQGRAESLPVGDNSYTFALLVTTACFIDDLIIAFREVARILEPGGHIIIGFINRESRLGNIYQANKTKSRFYRNAVFRTPDEIRVALQASGFHGFKFAQAILPGDISKDSKPSIKKGCGTGSFVVIKAQHD